MKNVGKVKLVFLRKRKNSKTFTALITNNTDLSTSQIIGCGTELIFSCPEHIVP